MGTGGIVTEGYVGEIFNSVQGEGFYVGRRQVFVRFAGCNWDCIYCDTEEFRNFRPDTCKIETTSGARKFKHVRNPMRYTEVLRHVRRLTVPSTHSISLTGGEPLLAGDFLVGVARACKRSGFATYLETNGVSSRAMRKVLKYIDVVAMDLKLPEHQAAPRSGWRRLFEEGLTCVRLALKKGVNTFVKIVILPSTRPRTVSHVSKHLAKLEVPVVLQPVTPARKVYDAPSMTHVCRLAKTAAKAGVGEIAIIPQVHKLIGVL